MTILLGKRTRKKSVERGRCNRKLWRNNLQVQGLRLRALQRHREQRLRLLVAAVCSVRHPPLLAAAVCSVQHQPLLVAVVCLGQPLLLQQEAVCSVPIQLRLLAGFLVATPLLLHLLAGFLAHLHQRPLLQLLQPVGFSALLLQLLQLVDYLDQIPPPRQLAGSSVHLLRRLLRQGRLFLEHLLPVDYSLHPPHLRQHWRQERNLVEEVDAGNEYIAGIA
mmetsp:Transcript_1316/g.2734  ORF Transcript_1316/g.2734 Transcript_1316/m.2734 type:complete len:220 (-) Transcript_1316:1061-1720(-)